MSAFYIRLKAPLCTMILATLMVAAVTTGAGAAVESPAGEFRGWVVIQQSILPSYWGGGDSEHVQRIVYADVQRSGSEAEWSGDFYYRFQVPDQPCQTSEQAGSGKGTASVQVIPNTNDSTLTQALPVPTDMLSFNFLANDGNMPSFGVSHSCNGTSGSFTGGESPTGSLYAGIAYPNDSTVPFTVGRSYSYVRSTYYSNEVTVCMSRSTVDSDGDGLPDDVDLAPLAAASAVELGIPGGPPTEEIPAKFGGPSGVKGVPQCPLNGSGQLADSDGDGVVDGADQCPDTPAGVSVDTVGCPLNHPPVAVDVSFTTSPMTPVDIRITATDPDPGDTVTLQGCGSAAGGSISINDGVITFTPDADFTGTVTFECTVADQHGATDTATVIVDVSAPPFVLTGGYAYAGGILLTSGATVAGSSAVGIVGPPGTLEGVQVCASATWTVNLNQRVATSVPVFWNGQTRPFESQELTGGFKKEYKTLISRKLTEWATYKSCREGTAATFGPFPDGRVLSITSPNEILSLSLSVTVSAIWPDGRTISLKLPSSKDKGGLIRWSQSKVHYSF